MVIGISYWELEQQTDDRVDSYGPNDLTIINEEGNRIGHNGYGFNCVRSVGGTRLEIEQVDQVGLDPVNDPFTIFGWLLSDEVTTSGRRVIACKKSLTFTSWALYIDGTLGLVFETSHNGISEDKLIYDWHPTPNVVYFWGVSYNPVTRSKVIVIDGDIKAQGVAFHDSTIYSGQQGFTIGGLSDGGWHFDGWIDEVGYCKSYFTIGDWTTAYGLVDIDDFILWVDGPSITTGGQSPNQYQGTRAHRVPSGFDPNFWRQ